MFTSMCGGRCINRFSQFYISFGILIQLVSSQMSSQPWRYYENMKENDGVAIRVRREYTNFLETELSRIKADVARLKAGFDSLEEKYDTLKSEVLQTDYMQRDAAAPFSYKVHCRSEFTWWHEAVGKSLEYLDNFDVHCRHGEFLRQWRMTWGEMSSKKAIRYVCCKYVIDRE